MTPCPASPPPSGVPGGWQALYAANRQAVGPDPNLIRAGTVLAVPGRQAPARYTVAPGDTLSGIAAALGVRGGWQALYAANKQAVGPDPDVIRAGTVLATPRPSSSAGASPAAHKGTPRSTATSPVRRQPPAPGADAGTSRQRPPGRPHAPGTRAVRQAASQPPGRARPARRAPAGPASQPGHASVPGHAAPGHATGAGGMPRWLEDVLLAAGVLAATAFAAEPAAALARRRRQAPAGPARPPHASADTRPRAASRGQGQDHPRRPRAAHRHLLRQRPHRLRPDPARRRPPGRPARRQAHPARGHLRGPRRPPRSPLRLATRVNALQPGLTPGSDQDERRAAT